ncbi:hypothetical protein YC2023_030107 [Brassica napus]
MDIQEHGVWVKQEEKACSMQTLWQRDVWLATSECHLGGVGSDVNMVASTTLLSDCQNMSKTEVSSLSQRSSSAKNIASETEEDKCESSQKRRRVENNSESEDPPEKQVVTLKVDVL